jgi:hypothetical protein
VEESVALGIEFFQFFAAALPEDGVAGVATIGRDCFFAIGGFVVAVMAAEAAIPFLVADVIGIGAPVRFHLGEEIGFVNLVGRVDDGVDFRVCWKFAFEGGRDFFEGLGFGLIRRDEGGDDI